MAFTCLWKFQCLCPVAVKHFTPLPTEELCFEMGFLRPARGYLLTSCLHHLFCNSLHMTLVVHKVHIKLLHIVRMIIAWLCHMYP